MGAGRQSTHWGNGLNVLVLLKMTDIHSHKAALRAKMRSLRAGLLLSDADRAGLVRGFFDAVRPDSGAIIAGYWPVGGECDAMALLDEAGRLGFACALPVVEDNTRLLAFAPYTSGCAMRLGAYGIACPDTDIRVRPDYVSVPLLAFTANGGRLGQGGGYYDVTLRALCQGGADVTAVGLAYAAQECSNAGFPVEPHDAGLDWIVTPERVYQCR